MADQASAAPVERRAVGVPGYPGPFAVGRYAGRLRDRLREFAPVCVMGEVTGARVGRGPNVYFELRDSDGALPCAMWRDDFERCGLGADELRDGVEVVAAGRCDYYPGSATSSPRFSFRVSDLRLAGEGDLLAQLARLRRQLESEGLFSPQKLLPRAPLPRRIGVVTAEGSAACRDFLAGLERRSWRGTIVWGYAPVQDRRAAPAIAAAIRDLAAVGEVDAIVVTRGGGSIADLWAFCDETLCRTIALTPVPVISAVGHEVDHTLIDDVAAVSCSTPTHAAEAVVRVDCGVARERLSLVAGRLDALGRAAVLARARALVAHSRAPRDHLARHRVRLHQLTREMRAAANRGRAVRIEFMGRIAAGVLVRRRDATVTAVATARRTVSLRAGSLEGAHKSWQERRSTALAAQAAALRGHDPERTLERGYALVTDEGGEPLATAAAVREARRFSIRLADGRVGAETRNNGGHADEH
jgi:exodeoxyribonuclease VII large subunit